VTESPPEQGKKPVLRLKKNSNNKRRGRERERPTSVPRVRTCDAQDLDQKGLPSCKGVAWGRPRENERGGAGKHARPYSPKFQHPYAYRKKKKTAGKPRWSARRKKKIVKKADGHKAVQPSPRWDNVRGSRKRKTKPPKRKVMQISVRRGKASPDRTCLEKPPTRTVPRREKNIERFL